MTTPKQIKYQDQSTKSIKFEWRSFSVLLVGLFLTVLLTWVTFTLVDTQEQKEFVAVANEIQLKIESRLQAHVLVLNATRSYFSVSDTVTRTDWKEFIEGTDVKTYLPGIQGIGYAALIPDGQMEEHIRRIRNEGFPNYKIHPEGERDTYTSIIYLEPFSGRNLRAFGYDMFSEPVRREAMEYARDINLPALTGKVDLVQETDEDVQAGTLIYVPLYKKGTPLNTVESRREGIMGWVYSPYRMNDLMEGILGPLDEVENPRDRIQLEVYDDSITVSSLLYDSQKNEPEIKTFFPKRVLTVPVLFNGKRWMLQFTKSRENIIFYGEVIILFISAIIITLLLFLLSLSVARISKRSSQIKKQNEELRKINATKDKFFSIIAHDLKSPFNTIVGFSEILVKHVTTNNFDGINRIAEIINSSALNAMDLLMNLMEWSRSQTGRMRYYPVKFNFIELLEEMQNLFKDTAMHKSITLRTDAPAKVSVTADRAMISTVLRNLISNAIKYTPEGGEVVVSVRNRQGELVVEVSDNGVGITGARLKKLFRIDENVSTTGTDDEKGTGLGLILCQEFVGYHSGRIWVESEEGKGSVFYFTIPDVTGKKRVKRKKTHTPFNSFRLKK